MWERKDESKKGILQNGLKQINQIWRSLWYICFESGGKESQAIRTWSS